MRSLKIPLTAASGITKAYPNCYLQLGESSSYIVTLTFAIGNKSGIPIDWTLRDEPTQIMQSQSSAAAVVISLQAGYTQPASAVASGRPSYTLNTDTPGKQHATGNTDCLNDADEFHAECWDVLNLDSWLMSWFLTIK